MAESEHETGAPAPRPTYTVKPFIAPCRDLAPSAPIEWLRSGWRDLRCAPGLSLAWGGMAVLLFAAVAWLAWLLGRWVLLISVLSGFVFVAPLLAFALYSVSRLHAADKAPGLRESLIAARRAFSNALVFALVLLVIFLLWARAASMVHIFFPPGGDHDLVGLLTFLGIGSAIGSVFALVTFAASAFSLPFIANRDVDIVTAVVSSINAVLRNKWTMLVWVTLIVSLTALGFLTALLGLVVIIPWLGYATWHGYRSALDVSGWKTLPDDDVPLAGGRHDA